MKRTLLLLIVLGTGGTILYLMLQALVPASRSQQEKAAQLLSSIQLVPSGQVAPGGEAKPAVEDVPNKPSQIEAQRNHYLASAIEALEHQSACLTDGRTNYFSTTAKDEQNKTGANPEKFLLDKVKSQNAELLMLTTQRGGFNGSADLQQAGRAAILDQLAALRAIQALYNNQPKDCLAEPYQAGEFTEQFLIRASQRRAMVEQDAKPTEEYAKNDEQQ
ncbi:MAG TPA: hypothetical protein V6D10_05850 [Trichocoleus sp.]|jgi:hypothetical protein